MANRETTYSQIVGTKLKMAKPQEEAKYRNILQELLALEPVNWFKFIKKIRPRLGGTEDSLIPHPKK